MQQAHFWTQYDPVTGLNSGTGAPPGLPGLALPSPDKKPSEFVIPDASVLFGRPDTQGQPEENK